MSVPVLGIDIAKKKIEVALLAKMMEILFGCR